MNFLLRFLVGYAIVTAVAVLLAMRLFTEQFVPGVRQSVEDMLVQTANLLAEVAAGEMRTQPGKTATIESLFHSYQQRRFEARIYNVQKNVPDLRVYVTDHQGYVLFDSRGEAAGQDYSRWRDVSRTLQGQYGARTSRDNPYDDTSSIMYVAAPIRVNGQIVGVLSVGKPSRSFQTFIDLGQREANKAAMGLFAVAMLLALVFSYWMTRDLRRLVIYANEAAAGKRRSIPIEGRSELKRLAQALEHLRAELDGKTHVERVTQLLAHELKSPIAAVRGAAELVEDERDPVRRARLHHNIRQEAERLQRIVEGVLELARAENRDRPPTREPLDMALLLAEAIALRESRLAEKSLRIQSDRGQSTLQPDIPQLQGDRFLLRQALLNLLDNAIDFSPPNGTIHLQLCQAGKRLELRVRDEGAGIPDYAQDRLFERFYSTPRPDSGQRGTGLGLNLVEQSARLHGGTITLSNHPAGGAEAVLSLPT
ncbi:MAG TPA: two-component system sensor histidine kinase CreC [Thiobacillus sp.]|nr:two-component system sensor histidine kinase CreC [Thiobacillus sp.]